jgi:hypothetical protein
MERWRERLKDYWHDARVIFWIAVIVISQGLLSHWLRHLASSWFG